MSAKQDAGFAPDRSRAGAILRRRLSMGLAVACASALCGCAVYNAKALPTQPDLTRAPALAVPAGNLGIPGLKPEPFDLTTGLTQINIVMLAVVDNPRLKAVRQQAGIADAQLLEAGLLPDPQLSGGLSRSSLFTGYSVSLTEDIRALVSRSTARDAARAHQGAVNLDILWQEWQVAAQARQLYIQVSALDQLRDILDQRRTVLATLYAREQASLREGFVTVSAVAADFNAWDAAESAWRDFELQDNHVRHALDELLGLAPTAQLHLASAGEEHRVTSSEFHSALNALPDRPDLLALQAGYRSQEERLRAAIIAQFPLLSAGVERARDPAENLESSGFEVNLTLPLFNRNRGAIAVERADRAYLYQAYQARLDETTNEADQVWNAVLIMQHQLETLDQRLTGLEQRASAARDSLRRGSSTFADYASAQANALAARAEQIQLRSALAQSQAALAVLLGRPVWSPPSH